MNTNNKYTVKKTLNKLTIEFIQDLTFDEAYKLCINNLNQNSYHIMMKLPVQKIIDAAAAGSMILVGYEEDMDSKVRFAENFMIKQNNF